MIVSVGKKPPQETGIKVKNHSSTLSLAHRRDFKKLLQGITGEAPLRLNDVNFKEFAGFQIALLNKVCRVAPHGLIQAWTEPMHHESIQESNHLGTVYTVSAFLFNEPESLFCLIQSHYYDLFAYFYAC